MAHSFQPPFRPEEEEDMCSRWCDVELPLGDAADSFNLETAVCSHGFFMMAPNLWDPISKSLIRPLHCPDAASTIVRVSQPSGVFHSILVRVFGIRSLSPAQHEAIITQVRRMLRLSDREDRKVREFQRMHADARSRGFGRVFRSPTLFEDMVKCILLCNCQWPRTLSMARALCELQFESQHNSSEESVAVGTICSKVSTVEMEHFAPRTPAGKEAKKKRKRSKNSKALFIQDAKTTLELEANLNSKEIPVQPGPQVLVKSVVTVAGSNEDDKGLMTSSCCPATWEAEKEGMQFYNHCKVGNFPCPKEIAALDEKYLSKRCGLGYRGRRILELAQCIVDGKIELSQLEELSGDDSLLNYNQLDDMLKEINGFGPFTRGNVLMCMGFYQVIPTDSETIRHLKQVRARSATVQTVQKVVEEIYGEFKPFQFLAYWSEIWNFYEEWFGKLSEMPSSSYKLITASNMNAKRMSKSI